MKKTITLLLTLCLLLGLLPVGAAAFAGGIYRAGDVKQVKMADGSLSLQNGYVHVTLHKLLETYSYLTVVPAAKPDEDFLWNSQTPRCNYTTYNQGVPTTEGVVTELKSMTFVSETPNGKTNAIKAEYDLLSSHSHVAAQVTVYYEIVQLKEIGPTAKDDTWGVLTTVGSIRVDKDSLPKDQIRDFTFTWGYSFNCFTAMGHKDNLEKSGGPAIKISRTTVPQVLEGETPKITTGSTTITASVEKLDTTTVPKGYSQWGEVDGVYITEAYVDSYPWANPFVGLSQYYKNGTIKAYLPKWVSVTPASRPGDTRVECGNDVGFYFGDENNSANPRRFLWGFRNLTKLTQPIPTNPDKVNISISAKRLAVFSSGSGVTVEHVADDAALEALKRQYKKDPAALINGDYESTNGEAFTFTGGAALLSPSVTATWDKTKGSLVIKKDGTVEQSGVSLSAPTFKFYQPKGSGKDLKIELTRDGFTFGIDPGNNDAIVYVDIPYATVTLEKATADVAGNLVFSGEIGFQTIFEGAEFTMKKLGYGLKGNEFKVNGVHATGSFTTAKMMALELADVKGEVNTFKDDELYAFELELNVFDLFETKAELELTRSKKDGSLLPNTLYFYVKASPGIPLIPPIPVGQLNGGGAGFMDLAKTVNGDYRGIPPIKLRGTLTGTYLHLIEGTGDVVIGPSEISLTATDVGIVGAGESAQIIKSFGYALKLNGQKRTYNGTDYEGVYLVGSEALELNLPSTELDVIVLDSSIELGAFGGVNKNKDKLYLGIGANGKVQGILQIPSNFFIPCLRGVKLSQTDIQLIIGGQTEFPISNVSVSEGMKQAFNNTNVYLGAMAQSTNWLYDVRAWVILPNIIKTNFENGKGWGLEGKLIKKLPEWKWEDHGVTPVVQAVSLEDGEEALVLTALEPVVLTNGSSENSTTIEVTANGEETPYILLAFGESVSEEDIKDKLSVKRQGENDSIKINWVKKEGAEGVSEEEIGTIDPNAEINAGTDLIEHADGNKYRVALLRLKNGGTYEVNTGSLTLVTDKSKGVAVTPFEKLFLELDSNSNKVSGLVEYAEMDTEYTLRTYLAEEKGGADYLIDEQIVTDIQAQAISVTVPPSGTHAPTGEYYVTSFLMTKKSVEVTDENGKIETVNALAAIDSWQSDTTVSYTNDNQPAAPASVTLTFVGNEVMRASWDAVTGADGYRVTVYQRDSKGEWKDTGFGYDLKKPDENGQPATSIDMALTVGGGAVKVSEENPAEFTNANNLKENEHYRIGVSAYKLVSTGLEESKSTSAAGETTVNPNSAFKGSKYYSEETQSADDGVFLPKYQELTMTLNVNGTIVSADENGVYHAYVGGKDNDVLAVSCSTENVTYKVTRMDTTDEITQETNGTYKIPTFEGSLMLKIDGMVENSSAKDVTNVFLLVSRDVTPPVLTLSDPVFFANRDTGEYTITGTADAGSEILYGGTETIYADSKGRFAVPGTLNTNSGILSLSAKDSAGNESAQQLALITRQTQYAVTVNGSYAQSSGAGNYAAGRVVTVRAGSRDGYTFNGWTSGSNVAFDDPNAAETTFTMPDGSVTVTANWSRDGGSSSSDRDDSDPSYAVGIPDKTENGSVSVSPKNASQGDRVTVTVKPDAGYELDSLKVLDKDGKELELTDKGDGKFSFVMPDSKVDVKATFVKSEVKPDQPSKTAFVDVPENSWYADAADFVAQRGLMSGVGENLFGGNQNTTRAMLMTILARMDGQNVTGGATWYEKAMNWAKQTGVSDGTMPEVNITREQLATMLYSYAKLKGLDTTQGGMAVREFNDYDSISSWAGQSMTWAVNAGILSGRGNNTLAPTAGATRAEMAVMLRQFVGLMEK